MRLSKKSILQIISLFIVVFICLQFFIYKNYTDKKEQYVSNKALWAKQHYDVTYKTFKDNSKHFYNSIAKNKKLIAILKDANSGIKLKEDKARAKLHKIFSTKYQLVAKLGIDLIHFHLNNNNSFYRRHKQDMFGDNLSNMRYSVAQVNETKQMIDGLEMGQFKHAFRFVYPVFDENKKSVGSLEGSVSSSAFIAYLERALQKHIHFVIDKDFLTNSVSNDVLLSQYTVGKALSNFLRLKRDIDKDFKHSNEEIQNVKLKLKNFNINNNTKKPFGFTIIKDNTEAIIIFIPVEDLRDKKTVAFFVVYDYNNNLLFLKDEYVINIYIGLLLSIILTLLLYKILKSKEKLAIEVQNKTQELEQLNKNLKKEIEKEVDKNRQQDKTMFHQSRLAQMGEMISMIAHQWRQPLAAISSTSSAISLKAKINTLDKDTTIELSTNIYNYSKHLSNTIDDFRDFFKSNKEKTDITYDELIQSVLNIIEVSLINKNIELITKLSCKDMFISYPNEIKQVILNLIKNAEDILEEKLICDVMDSTKLDKKPQIIIETKNGVLTVSDNGGGIADDIIDKIFDPYFSTKIKKDGTGLGLYMSKTIIEEHCGGKLSVSNNKDGAVFKIDMNSIIGKNDE